MFARTILQKKKLKIKHYPEGVYQGKLNNKGQRHGKGSFLWDTGEMYVGYWKLNKMSGEGIFCFANGGYMIGEFLDNNFNGAFYISVKNGNCFFGKYREGKFHGK
jgi:hypothetical protein